MQVNADTADEPNETFNVDLSNATIATIADARGVGTITDDDLPDTSPPETAIGQGDEEEGQDFAKKKVKAKFEFSSSEPSSFECKLDRESFKSCSSPFARKVKPGKHTFQVRATDAVGNVDPTPAKRKWKVKRKK